MKFAKKLQEESLPLWNDKYIDYKMMKKVLKRLDSGAMQFFCEMYEAQLMKVQEFMTGRQEEIIAGISPLELDLRPNFTLDTLRAATLEQQEAGNHCEQLVEDIQVFQTYASLNIVGMRKIIKKFDKRFQLRFHDVFGPIREEKMLVSDGDIGKLLLVPAQKCLRLMRSTADPSNDCIDRPLRQYNFWLEELKAGSQIARLRVSGNSVQDTTRFRLAMRFGGNEDLGLCVKNTFIDDDLEVQSPTSRRSSSEPRRLRLMVVREESDPDRGAIIINDDTSDAVASIPLVNVEHFICKSLQIPPLPRVLDLDDVVPGDVGFCPTPSPRSVSPCRGESLDEALPQAVPPGPLPAPRLDTPVDMHSTPELGNRATHFPTPPKAKSSGRGRGRGRGSPCPNSVVAAPNPSAGFSMGQDMGEFGDQTSYRWWSRANTAMACPISGFPIHLLPYPPFKFHKRSEHTKEPPVLVDGPFLVLQVISTWNFNVLGRPLLVADVTALDSYMKRCKLGPFRLGRAMELLAAGTSGAQRELVELQEQARRKLDNLRHVQTFRKGSGQEAQPPRPRKKPKERGRATEPQERSGSRG